VLSFRLSIVEFFPQSRNHHHAWFHCLPFASESTAQLLRFCFFVISWQSAIVALCLSMLISTISSLPLARRWSLELYHFDPFPFGCADCLYALPAPSSSKGSKSRAMPLPSQASRSAALVGCFAFAAVLSAFSGSVESPALRRYPCPW